MRADDTVGSIDVLRDIRWCASWISIAHVRGLWCVFACLVSGLACGPKAGGGDGAAEGGETGTVGSTGAVAAAETDAGPGETTGGEGETTAEVGIEGQWLGYANGLQLQSGSDRVLLDIAAVGPDGQVIGTASFGTEGTLAPAVDGGMGYPPQALLPGNGFGLFPVETFAYPMTGTYDASSERLLVTVQVNEVWTTWCALQPSYAWGTDSYNCVPNCGFGSDGTSCTLPCEDGEIVMACDAFRLCDSDRVCECDEASCTFATGPELELDLHLDELELTGPIEGLGTAYLTKQ